MARDPGFRPTDDSRDKLTVMRAKLADYSLLINKLAKVYKDDVDATSFLEATLIIVRQVNGLADVLMGAGRPATEQDVRVFQEKWTNLAESMIGLNAMARRSSEFKKVLDKLSGEMNVNVEEMHESANLISKENIEMKEESFGDYIKRAHPETAYDIKAAKSDIFNQALGPYATIGKAAWGAISGIKGHFQAKAARAKRGRYWSAYGPSGYDMGGAAPGFGGAGARGSGGTGIGDIFQQVREGESSGFEEFFGKKAYTTRYTKELLQSIKDLKDGGKGGGGGMMDSIKAGLGFGAGGWMMRTAMPWIMGTALPAIGAFLMSPVGWAIIGTVVAAGLLYFNRNWIGTHWDQLKESVSSFGGKAKKATIGALSTAGSFASSPYTSSFAMAGLPGAAATFGASLVNSKRTVPSAEELAGAGPLGGVVNAMHEVVNTIKDSFAIMAKTVSAGNAQSTIIAPRGKSSSPYKAADPLIDHHNKNSEE